MNTQQARAAAAPAPYGPLGLGLSLVAIAVLFVAGALAAFFLFSLFILATSGPDRLKAILAGLNALTGDRAALAASTPAQVISLVVYAACGGAVVIMAHVRATAGLPFAQRLRPGAGWRALVAWRDWRRDGVFWAFVAAGLAYQITAGLILESVLPDTKTWFALPASTLGRLLSFLLVVVLGPLVEELVFRGWIFTSLRARFTFAPVMLVTAALFAAAHYESTHLYALVVFPIGLALGYVRERYASIKASTALHGSFNLFAWLAQLAGV